MFVLLICSYQLGALIVTSRDVSTGGTRDNVIVQVVGF
jgi:hypothetical protein